jgi:hypothetical protein
LTWAAQAALLLTTFTPDARTLRAFLLASAPFRRKPLQKKCVASTRLKIFICHPRNFFQDRKHPRAAWLESELKVFRKPSFPSTAKNLSNIWTRDIPEKVMVHTDIRYVVMRFSISNFAFLPTACQGWEGVEIRARHFFQRCSGASD